jgi:hypothetical protein
VKECKLFLNQNPEYFQSQRAYRNLIPWKVFMFYKGFILLLVEKGFLVNLKEIQEELNLEDVIKILDKHVNFTWIFYDMTRIVIRKSYDNLYSPQKGTKELKETSLCVAKNSVFYEYRRVLALYLCTILIEYMITKDSSKYKNLKENHSSNLEVIRNFLWRKQTEYDTEDNKWWVTDFSTLTHVFITAYQKSGTVQELVKERREKYKETNSKNYSRTK